MGSGTEEEQLTSIVLDLLDHEYPVVLLKIREAEYEPLRGLVEVLWSELLDDRWIDRVLDGPVTHIRVVAFLGWHGESSTFEPAHAANGRTAAV